jgi:hypothetical protein
LRKINLAAAGGKILAPEGWRHSQIALAKFGYKYYLIPAGVFHSCPTGIKGQAPHSQGQAPHSLGKPGGLPPTKHEMQNGVRKIYQKALKKLASEES